MTTRVRVEFVLNIDQFSWLTAAALRYGFNGGAIPKSGWTDEEQREAARFAIKKIIEETMR